MNLTPIVTDHTKPRIGLFGIGLDAYWPQFAGLKERLEANLAAVAAQLSRPDIELINLGLIDNPKRAMEAGHEFRRADVDMIFLYVTTYALSATVLPVVRRAAVPVVILNLSPGAAMDYAAFNAMRDRTSMTGIWLEWCSACPTPEIANVFNRCGIAFHQITGMLRDDPHVNTQIRHWLDAVKTAHVMAHNRLGIMGHYYSGMLDIYADLTLHAGVFGGHMEMLEVDELAELRKHVSSDDIDRRVAHFRDVFDVQPDCPDEELRRAARTSIALDQLILRHDLGSLCYYYMGEGSPENEDAVSSIILGNSLLTARGIPVAGEMEVANVQAMKIMDALGAGGSFTEYYGVDFNDNILLMGHDGPGHIAIAEGKTKVRPLRVYHGKVGRGLSVEMSVRHGPVTLLSVVQGGGGRIKLIYAHGESVPGPILEIGNTNSRYRFATGVREFMEAWNRHGPAHHCATGVGHIGDKIEKFGQLLGIETHRIA